MSTTSPSRGQIKGGTHVGGVDVGRLRQPFQRQCHSMRRPLSREGFDLSESEKEGGEKERKGETKLHRAKRRLKRALYGRKMKQDIGFYTAAEHSGLATAD